MLHRLRALVMQVFFGCAAVAACSPPARTPAEIHSAPAVESEHAAVVAQMYTARLRLGLGSPFRLMEIASRDERLGAARERVVLDLLEQAEHGDMYHVDARSFLATGMPLPNANAHLQLIRQTIEGSSNPRVGELAVNLAYHVAVAEGVIARPVAARATAIAGLLTDRRLAQRDMSRLKEAARRERTSPDELIAAWRAERRFSVEAPTLAPLDRTAQEDASRLAVLLGGGVRAASVPVAGSVARPPAPPVDLSGVAAAAVAESTEDSLPQGAVVITLRAIRAGITNERARVAAPNWTRFFERAVNEETAVAEAAVARETDADDVVAAGILVEVASALRPFAQERIAADSVSADDLKTRFGVRVRIAKSVAPAQRTRALSSLRYALDDVRSVIRSVDLTGLTIYIAPIPENQQHLAFHEPRGRVIHLDPATMAGTLAHEIGHDLDWQLARRRYNTRRSYATDYARRNATSLAYEVENLVTNGAPMETPSEADRIANRPAEIFARRFEWYVAAALAMEGRSNGDLSSVQNDWNNGYGSAARPGANAASAKAFAAILADAARMDRLDRSRVERLVIHTAPLAVRGVSRSEPLEQILGSCVAVQPWFDFDAACAD